MENNSYSVLSLPFARALYLADIEPNIAGVNLPGRGTSGPGVSMAGNNGSSTDLNKDDGYDKATTYIDYGNEDGYESYDSYNNTQENEIEGNL